MSEAGVVTGRPESRSLGRLRRATAGSLLLYAALLVGAILTLTPFLWTLSTSLKTPQTVFSIPPTLIPRPVYWQNYTDALNAAPLFRFLWNSAFLATTITVLRLATCSMAAYAFGRLRFPGRDTLFLLFLGTMMIPEHVTLIPNFVLMKFLHFYNTYKALILPSAFSVFGTFLLRQYFMTLPYELEEAARIDGCSRIGSFVRIILPLSKPALATLGVLTFKGIWNWFLWPLVMLNDYKAFPIQVGLAFFQGQVTVRWGPLMAGTTLAMLPVLIVFFLGQKHFIQSMALAGLGGR